jgi:hypothetical protein
MAIINSFDLFKFKGDSMEYVRKFIDDIKNCLQEVEGQVGMRVKALLLILEILVSSTPTFRAFYFSAFLFIAFVFFPFFSVSFLFFLLEDFEYRKEVKQRRGFIC